MSPLIRKKKLWMLVSDLFIDATSGSSPTTSAVAFRVYLSVRGLCFPAPTFREAFSCQRRKQEPSVFAALMDQKTP